MREKITTLQACLRRFGTHLSEVSQVLKLIVLMNFSNICSDKQKRNSEDSLGLTGSQKSVTDFHAPGICSNWTSDLLFQLITKLLDITKGEQDAELSRTSPTVQKLLFLHQYGFMFSAGTVKFPCTFCAINFEVID